MRKQSVDLAALEVERCVADAEGGAPRGTVQAHGVLGTGVYSCWNAGRCPSHHNTECC
ncbi:MAG TPA: hypothetical protein VFJ16_01805 [Longimicrobium sp.]|nr:hypothetical protein [Longimicrobium sp.]